MINNNNEETQRHKNNKEEMNKGPWRGPRDKWRHTMFKNNKEENIGPPSSWKLIKVSFFSSSLLSSFSLLVLFWLWLIINDFDWNEDMSYSDVGNANCLMKVLQVDALDIQGKKVLFLFPSFILSFFFFFCSFFFFHSFLFVLSYSFFHASFSFIL